MEEFKSKIFHLNENERFVNDISKEEEQILLNNTAKKIAYQDGISKGITQGEQQKQLEIAKKVLNIGLPIEDVSSGTGLSVKELENLKNIMIQA